MKAHHFNFSKEPETKRFVSHTIKKGVAANYSPSFERGDTATRKFAENSKEALENGGISIAFGTSPDRASIVKAMSILQGLLNQSFR